MPSTKAGRLIATVIILVGAVLLIAAVFMPWYAEQASGTVSGQSITITRNAYLGLPSSNGTLQYTCSGLPAGFSCLSQTSYSAGNATHTGNIAEAVYFLAIAGFILGLIGGLIGLMSRGNSRRATPAIALAIVAMILAIAATGMFAVALPGAISSDTPGNPGCGPGSTFFGSSSNGTCVGAPASETATWGPAIGWYLALVGFVVLLVGVILILRYRKDPPAPAPTATPSPVVPTAAGSPPTS
jgi:uncharacterized membrane protein